MQLIHKRYFKRIGLAWLVTLLVFFFAYAGLLKPRENQISRNQQQIVASKAEYERTYRMSQEIQAGRFTKRLGELKDKLDSFSIEETEAASLIFDISLIAKQKGINSFHIESEDRNRRVVLQDCEHISESYISADFPAGFNQFASFLNALERHEPVVFVDGFSIIRVPDESKGHEVTVNLSVFVRRQQDG